MVATFFFHLFGIFISTFSCIFFNMNGLVKYRDTGDASKENMLSMSMLVLGVFGSFQSLIFLFVLQCTISLTRNKISVEPESSSSSNEASSNSDECHNHHLNTVLVSESQHQHQQHILGRRSPFPDSDSPPKYDSPVKCEPLPDYDSLPPPSYDLTAFKYEL